MMNMKKLLALLLAIVMVVGMFPMNVFAENEEPAHLDSCTEGCAGCECACHQVNPASDDPAEPESPADNCPNCDNADCIGCDGEAKLQNDDGEAKDEVCETCQKDPCECKGEVCETCQKDPCECKSEVCETCQKDPCECKGEVCETCQKDPCECKGEVCETCQKDPCECKNTEETKCGICGGEHADKDCTYCLSCKTDRSNCVICEECETHAGDHRIDCSKAKKPDMATPPEEETLFAKLMAAETAAEMYRIFIDAENNDMAALFALTFEEIEQLRAHVAELYPEEFEAYNAGECENKDVAEVLDYLTYLPNSECPDCGLTGEHKEDCPRVTGVVLANNVHNVTQNKWYDTLSAATAAANANNVIEVYNSFTETATVKILKNGLTIRAAAGKNPTISWTKTDEVPVSGATPYHCVVIYTAVTTSTTFGGGTGTLTFDATRASDADNKGKRARVLMHCGSGNLNIGNGIVITGGNPGGGSYDDKRVDTPFPSWSGEIVGEVGFGAGIYMYNGTLNMSGGVIKDNYSLWGATAADRKTSHNYVGGGGGVYLYHGTMNMTGGTITHNAAGSGGGAGILVGHGAKLNVSGGTISENVVNFASGGGIGVRTESEVKISGGNIINNRVTGHGGGLFARGDSIPLEITGGIFEGNEAGSYGGGVLFWTVGDDVSKNTVIIGGNTQIKNNKASQGGGVSVGREVLDGKPVGRKAKLVIQGNPIISGNTATLYGGGIEMQSDEFATDVNVVEISGGTISGNEAKDGGGIYVPGGTVTMTGGTFSGNKASDRGAGIFTGGGTMTLSNATFTNNIADGNGGGAFVQGGQVIMNSGSFTANEADNGGALYVNNGTFTMNDGSVNSNKATGTDEDGNGGGAYVAGGNVTITHGTLNSNEAVKGGAVYMAGSEDTTLTMESGEMSSNIVTDDGGAIFATNGTIYIGLLNCQGTDADLVKHTQKGIGRHHPKINNNRAGDTGGGIAVTGDGVVHFYCGEANGNEALYKGVGKNVFMDGGEFYLYDGADVGVTHDPDLVIIGGELHNMIRNEVMITLQYFADNDDTTPQMTGMAEYQEFMNLPDAQYFFKNPPADSVFIGWTAQGIGDEHYVRNKAQYIGSGDPVQILDHAPTEDAQPDDADYQTWINTKKMVDGKNDKIIKLYALWAPKTSKITYVDGMTGQTMTHAPATYNFDEARDSQIIKIPAIAKSGYDQVGWYIYQDSGKNANWNNPLDTNPTQGETIYEPNYTGTDYSKQVRLDIDRNGVLDLETGFTNFGDITLIAIYVPAYTDLRIKKDGCNSTIDENQSFVFNIKGQPTNTELGEIDINFMILGNGEVLIKEIPVGNYTVKELSDWSWRYGTTTVEKGTSTQLGEPVNGTSCIIEISDSTVEYAVNFNNTRTNAYWLDGNDYVNNEFGQAS